VGRIYRTATWIHATLLSAAGITAKLDDEFLKQHKIAAAKLQKKSQMPRRIYFSSQGRAA